LKAVDHIIVSSAETMGAFNTAFDAINLHRPTIVSLLLPAQARHHVPAQVEIESER
jgi:hypothetical protein